MPRCSRNLQQRLAHCTEEQAINHLWILQRERREQVGQREYHMRVWHGQQIPLLRLEPCGRSTSLALRAVTIAA